MQWVTTSAAVFAPSLAKVGALLKSPPLPQRPASPGREELIFKAGCTTDIQQFRTRAHANESGILSPLRRSVALGILGILLLMFVARDCVYYLVV